MDKIIVYTDSIPPFIDHLAGNEFDDYEKNDIHPRVNIIDFRRKSIYFNTVELTRLVSEHYKGYVNEYYEKITLHNHTITKIARMHDQNYFGELPQLIYHIDYDDTKIKQLMNAYKKNKFEFVDFNLIF